VGDASRKPAESIRPRIPLRDKNLLTHSPILQQFKPKQFIHPTSWSACATPHKDIVKISEIGDLIVYPSKFMLFRVI
jgi:hypothetical protein